MAHEYKKEAEASHERKLKSYGSKTSSTADKANEDGDATNFAGFRALNTNKQAGMAPLNKKGSMSEETNPRIMRKKGGRVHGAESLKRLDKAPRKGKAAGGGLQGTGQRVGPIPSADTQQMDFDPTTRVKPGQMTPGTMRKKGGRIKKAGGGGFEDILGSIGNALFGEEEAAPARREATGSARGVGRHSAPHPVVRRRITETEHPVSAMGEDVPMPPRRPAELSAPAAAPMSDADATANFLQSQGIGARPAPAPSADSSTANPFFAEHLYRKNGGRLGRASGGKSEHPDEAEDKALIRKMVKKEDLKMKDGGRAHRSKGGKTTVNIMLGQPQQQGMNPMALAALADMAGGPEGGPPQQLPPPGAMPPPGAGAPPMAGPPPQMPPQMPPQAGPGGPPMPRARGGRTFADIKVSKPKIKDGYPALTGGSGGGKGRREKILAYGDEQK
jgi:hypothetical protein